MIYAYLQPAENSSQSAVASPEVKQHLKEFVSRRKKEDAASVASTGNLKAASAGPTSGQPPPQPILRKTASESNLLKVGISAAGWTDTNMSGQIAIL